MFNSVYLCSIVDNTGRLMDIPSGNVLHSYGKIHQSSWENSLYMAMFNSYLTNYQRVFMWVRQCHKRTIPHINMSIGTFTIPNPGWCQKRLVLPHRLVAFQRSTWLIWDTHKISQSLVAHSLSLNYCNY